MDIAEKIEELEKRIKELEARPIMYPPVYVPYPVYPAPVAPYQPYTPWQPPFYPSITWGNNGMETTVRS